MADRPEGSDQVLISRRDLTDLLAWLEGERKVLDPALVERLRQARGEPRP